MCSENGDDGSMRVESIIGVDCDGNEKSIGMFCTLFSGVVLRGRTNGRSLFVLQHDEHEESRGIELGREERPFIVGSLSRLGIES